MLWKELSVVWDDTEDLLTISTGTGKRVPGSECGYVARLPRGLADVEGSWMLISMRSSNRPPNPKGLAAGETRSQGSLG